MANWTDLTQAVADLRRFVNDGPTDRPVKRKQVIGRVDGTNVNFMTFDDRIIETSLTVSINDAQVDPGDIVVLDATMGQFTLATAPSQQTQVRASYYFQYFFDIDLVEAMEMASQEITESDIVVGIPSGLKLAALNFGAYLAFTKMAIRWAQRKSAQFMLEEEPLSDDNTNRSNLFNDLAKSFYKQAIALRDGYYMRHGRRQAPAFNVFKPNTMPSPPFPRR